MSKRMMTQEQFRSRRRWYRFFMTITVMILLITAATLGMIAGLFASVSQALPPGEALANIRPPVPTRILAADGTLLARIYLPDQNREIVSLRQMKSMVYATLAIEDIRFYEHPGVDIRGILRALVKNIIAGNSKEGASTITQQLARNLYLSRTKKIERKLQEVLIALELERHYSKEEILETYLNQVFYGANQYGLQSWGAQMAAHNYFNKDVSELTIAEAALLAGLPKNPRDYNPYRFPKAATERRNTVLRIMLTNGFINQQQFDKAIKAPIKLAPEIKVKEMADFYAPYFVRDVLVNELPKIFGQDASRLVYHYGIDIYTSLDPRMQKVAEEEVTDQVQKNKFRRIDDGALISLDPRTGFIKAMVGGTDYRNDQYNIVTQGHRQPGSAFKPFVYTTALIHGYTPDTIVHDSPRQYPTGDGRFWSPKNSDGGYRGAMALKRALWASRNCAAAGVAYDVGIDNIIATAHRMGIKYPLERYLSTSLGASVVVPLEICSGYGTLANHGVYNEPTGVVRVTTPDGMVLYEHSPRPRRAVPAEIADTMKDVMRGVIERGTGRAARCPFPASGKTGTTNSYRDAWFIGYTDDLVTAVWVGNRHNQPMNRTFGGTVPAPIWRAYMVVAQPIMAAEHKGEANELTRVNDLPEMTDLDTTPTPYIEKIHGDDRHSDRTTPEVSPSRVSPGDEYTVVICQQTGDRAGRWCPETVAVTYIKGRAPVPPTRTCTVHTGPEAIPYYSVLDEQDEHGRHNRGTIISICAETQKIATDRCPIVLQRRFLRDAPTETCPLHGE